MVNSPDNTTQQVEDDSMLGLITALDPQGSGIYAQEAAGQRQLVNSDVLPSEIFGERADFEALGFVFGDPVPGDEMFTQVTLPEGWKREGSSHSMWSHVVDERGVRRVSIFYKAAFYDRSAHMSLNNVGHTLARDLFYADDPTIPENEKRPIDLSVFTPEEIVAANRSLTTRIEQDREAIATYAANKPERYEQGIARAEAAKVKLAAL